ncbi:hypothetical protein [Streptomyces sp. NPDC002889]|uniref:hypothetical protein n=1 Tax=Streptomyces sp. NPDC002889 TaxID=3364669 RepID=UPI003689ECAA
MDSDTGGFGIGAEVTRTACFPGKRIDYVLRVAAYEPLRLLGKVSVAGPMPVHVTWRFTPRGGGTPARIRVRGDARGSFRIAAPPMARTVRSSLTRDLRDLEHRLTPSA